MTVVDLARLARQGKIFIRPYGRAIFSLLMLLLFLAGNVPANALSKEQAISNCRGSVGRPFVQSCMRNGGSMPSCMAAAVPKVSSCVATALNAVNGRENKPLELKTDSSTKEEKADTSIALPVGFVAPPRSIADISAILDSEKPDFAKLNKRKLDAEKEPLPGASRSQQAELYLDRANARSELGRADDAISDGEKALSLADGSPSLLVDRVRQFLGIQQQAVGDLKSALMTFQDRVRFAPQQGSLFNSYRLIAGLLVQMGDVAQAEGYMRRNDALLLTARTSGNPAWRKTYPLYGRSFEADVEANHALVLEARGQYNSAEVAYKKSEDWRRAAIPDLLKMEFPPSESVMLFAADATLLSAAKMKARQGRLAEAEADARRALLNRLKDQGKYHPYTSSFLAGLAGILVEEGRYSEAESLTRNALEIQRTIGIADDTLYSARLMAQLATILNLQHKTDAAAQIYAELDKNTAKWDEQRRQSLDLGGGRIAAYYAAGQLDQGIAAARELVKRNAARMGDKHFETAAARGALATGLALAGKDSEAAREFTSAIPILIASSREIASDDENTAVVARTQRLQTIVEAYIGLVARSPQLASPERGLETFSLADAIRGQSVQRALSASSARDVPNDPDLAKLVRSQQDLDKQLNAELGALNNALGSNVRDDKVIAATAAEIDKLRADRNKQKQEISRRFPSYADLIDPKSPSIEDVQATLTDDEAVLSFYFGQKNSFVWAVPKNGPVAFAALNLASGDIESKVRKLREALEPQVAMISDIPPFDVKLGYELYSLLLKPVEAGWKHSKSLIVITNGALGLLPLALLPTAPAEINKDDDPLFSSYRKVPWLARTHAVTMVPSSAALRTLRALPPAKPVRSELIAFGDPLFSLEQAAEAAKSQGEVKLADAATTRGLPLKRRSSPKLDGVDSAELAMLPRLPDTADELRSIAVALHADPSQVLNLGKNANEQKVKTMDLSGSKVLAFATHGLVPGELDGLTQPALALSAPAVAGIEGDGLLTMEEILTLKLDADWVVLSACNTGAGEGAGAEAASGLGRAFFYAGTRAILVTNWSVHSQSAKDLVTELFKRQADDPKLTRGEALRQAMISLMDGPGYVGSDGKTEFAYAHPLFWAPYSIIGDGGRR